MYTQSIDLSNLKIGDKKKIALYADTTNAFTFESSNGNNYILFWIYRNYTNVEALQDHAAPSYVKAHRKAIERQFWGNNC